MKEFVDVIKALSDDTRLRIVWLLARGNSKLCVCELVDSLKKSQHNVSRHLKVLRFAGLVQERKVGRWVFYSSAGISSRFHKAVLQAVLALPRELLSKEMDRLKARLSLRVNGRCVIGTGSRPARRTLTGAVAAKRCGRCSSNKK